MSQAVAMKTNKLPLLEVPRTSLAESDLIIVIKFPPKSFGDGDKFKAYFSIAS